MRELKPFASLSSGLLARKGQAKPAMRPGTMQFGGQDDLGWNDMGDHRPAADAESIPEVIRQQAEVVREFGRPMPRLTPMGREPDPAIEYEDEPEAETEAVAPADPAEPSIVPVSRARGLDQGKAKAAFTLRLDADRHLRLRLACAISHRSAQQIVTEALDRLLSARPDVDAAAETLPSRATTKNT